jgi:hypothetical protein
MSWIRTGRPSIILVMDAFITENNDNSFALRQTVKTVTRTDCTTIFIGNLASTVVDLDALDNFFANIVGPSWGKTHYGGNSYVSGSKRH